MMIALFRILFASITIWGISSCTWHCPSGFVGNIVTVETLLYPQQPFYYMGRKGNRDYFLFNDWGVERRLSAPAGDVSVGKPFPYTRDRKAWTTLNDRSVPWIK
jgi:hypothetical protein